MVLSKLFYCSTAWSDTFKQNIHKLQLAQRFAARLLTNTTKLDHISPVLPELGWSSINHLGPVPRKMIKFNQGLSEILSTVFLLRTSNSSLQNTVEPLLCDTVMIYTKCFSKQCIGR